MGNIFRIFVRDCKRLVKAPAALIVVLALLVLPSIYTWYNVAAFWNPYENTGNLRVCVVNEDAGASTEMTGQLNVGDRIVDELLANEQLKWSEESRETALGMLEAGDVYAVYVIPEDFSACLVSPLTGDVKHPHLQYYVNEKLGPVSPKITDTAASTLEQTINSMFVSTVSDVSVNVIDESLEEVRASADEAQTKIDARVGTAKDAVENARAAMLEIQEATGSAKEKVSTALSALDSAASLVASAQTTLQDVSSGAGTIQTALSNLSSEAVPKLESVLVKTSQATSKAATLANGFAAKAGEAQSETSVAIGRIQPVINAMQSVGTELQNAADAFPGSTETQQALKERLADAAARINDRAGRLQGLVDETSSLSVRISTDAGEVAAAASELDSALQQASQSPQAYADKLYGGTVSSITAACAQVESTSASLSAAASNLNTTIAQAQLTLKQLDGLLDDSAAAVEKTSAFTDGLGSELDAIVTDVNLLAQSGAVADLVESGTLNAQAISEFMSSPTELNTVKLFPVNAYGSAMAPLFMNLTFWIGAFMLMIIFRLEADSEDVKGVKVWQRYLGRFLLFGVIAIVQSAVCCAGVLALGVQASNVIALFLAAAASSLAYLSIIYALSYTFRHVGQGLCIVLVFAQIPGGSGLYPIEMTSRFFQTIYPFLPFSYGIGAMREAICGLYGNYYAVDLLALGVFFVMGMVLALAVGPLMTNVTRMTAVQVCEGDLYNGEDVMTPERPFRLSQVLRVLTDREDYRHELEVRYERFSRRYPIFIRASIVLGVAIPVALATLMALDAAEKVTLLTLLLLWMVGLFVFVVVVESLRYSFERQLGLDGMSNEGVLDTFAKRNRMFSASGASVPGVRRGGSDASPDSGEHEPGEEERGGEADDA